MKQYCYDYPRPSVTVDIACFAKREGRPHVLLIQRAHPPFEGGWALPGGFVDEHEPLERAATRELEEETGIVCTDLEQFRAYGDPGRDPRGHTVTILFIATLPECVTVSGMDDAAQADWFPLDALPALAFDHHRLVPEAFDRWRSGNNA
jgi:8-oxo-dGTP diphosphatase